MCRWMGSHFQQSYCCRFPFPDLLFPSFIGRRDCKLVALSTAPGLGAQRPKFLLSDLVEPDQFNDRQKATLVQAEQGKPALELGLLRLWQS